MSNKTTKLDCGRFVPPWVSDIPFESTISEDYTIESLNVALAEKNIDPGTEVQITMKDGDLVAKPMKIVKQEQEEEKRRRELAKRARERNQARKERLKREERREFWNQYDIPIPFTIQDNTRIGQLQRGSTGTGKTSNTVEHFVVKESFTEGRLSRENGEFLCQNAGERGHWGIGKKDLITDPDETTPKITCKTCLKRMERWK